MSGIDLPSGEQSPGQFYYPGHMPAGDTWYPGVTPMMGIGQGYTAVIPDPGHPVAGRRRDR